MRASSGSWAREAKALVRGLIARHDMPVTFQAGIAHACRKVSEVAHSHAYAEKLARDYGYDRIEPLDRDGIRRLIGSDAYVGGDIDRGAGHLHPLNFAIGLARACDAAGVRLHEQSLVTRIVHGAEPAVETDRGRVRARWVVLGANGYLGGLEPSVAARVMPINNFILATEPLGARAADVLAEPVAVADTRFVVNYWRLSEDGRLLFGGGESYGYRFPDIARTVRKPMLEVYPQLRDVAITHAWGGTLAITMNRMPCFARVAPNVLSASGYSGARRGDGDACGAVDGRGGGGSGRTVRPDGRAAPAALPRRGGPALAGAGAGDELVCDAGPARDLRARGWNGRGLSAPGPPEDVFPE